MDGPSHFAPTSGLAPGAALARGVGRHLRDRGFAVLLEFVPEPGLRVDVIALGPRAAVWIVECKSCRADFVSDRKWPGYLPWCDRFFMAVPAGFPDGILPAGAGLIRADPYGAEIEAMSEARPLSAPRRRALVERFARVAAGRLAQLEDPDLRRRFAPG
jgi:hypothetical protein